MTLFLVLILLKYIVFSPQESSMPFSNCSHGPRNASGSGSRKMGCTVQIEQCYMVLGLGPGPGSGCPGSGPRCNGFQTHSIWDHVWVILYSICNPKSWKHFSDHVKPLPPRDTHFPDPGPGPGPCERALRVAYHRA